MKTLPMMLRRKFSSFWRKCREKRAKIFLIVHNGLFCTDLAHFQVIFGVFIWQILDLFQQFSDTLVLFWDISYLFGTFWPILKPYCDLFHFLNLPKICTKLMQNKPPYSGDFNSNKVEKCSSFWDQPYVEIMKGWKNNVWSVSDFNASRELVRFKKWLENNVSRWWFQCW